MLVNRTLNYYLIYVTSPKTIRNHIISWLVHPHYSDLIYRFRNLNKCALREKSVQNDCPSKTQA